jgi:hypothetical protein
LQAPATPASPAPPPAAKAPPTPIPVAAPTPSPLAAATPPPVAAPTPAPLEGLADVVVPEPVSALPQTVGWYVLFTLLAALLVSLGVGLRRRRAANRYRREALAELDAIVARLEEKGGRYDVAARLPLLLKRVALAVAPREDVAALTGKEWLAFLDRLYGGDGFSKGPGRLLPKLAYGTPAFLSGVPRADIDALLRLTREWIGRHRAVATTPLPAGPPAHGQVRTAA